MTRPLNPAFQQSLTRMNQIKRRTHLAYVALSLLRSLGIAILVMSLWNDVVPNRPLINIIIGIVTFIGIARFSSLWRSHMISPDSLLIALDIQYPQTSPSPFTAGFSPDPSAEWETRLAREEKRLWAWEQRRMTTHAGSLLVSLMLALLMLYKSPANLSVAFGDARTMVSALTGGITLDVISGLPITRKNSTGTASISLSSLSESSVELLPENMVRLTVIRVDHKAPAPVIKLIPEDQSEALTIQMSAESGNNQSGNAWTAEFSISHSSDIVIPSTSQKKLARVKVIEPPTPKVLMSVDGGNKDPWPDQDLLPLKIDVTSTFPLDKVALRVTSRGKTSKESVLNISGDTLHVETSYKLNLQPWMEEDIMEFTIVAEATDRSEGQGLTGLSAPIHIKVASAYGRYRDALESLRQVKIILDEARSSGKPLDPKTGNAMTKALRQANDTPFFDSLDRVELERLDQELKATLAAGKSEKIPGLSEDLSKFLLEHEMLDDRERDRDFFIAIRAFSRLLDREGNQAAEISHMQQRMIGFLDERHKRWGVRVERLGAGHEPASWRHIQQQKPFHGKLRSAASGSKDNRQADLAALASEYRAWIEELEAKEDAARARQEQERQQGVANARNELREIQQRQDQISSSLDRASENPSDEMSRKWAAARPQQNSNIKQSKGLLQKLKALAPNAGERLERAIEAMDQTASTAEASQWAQAEQAADLAGRLLRDADQAASKSQKNQERGRRRKTGGDDYHGTSIGGQVEIKRQYEVNPRYREDILREIDSDSSSSEDRLLLDNWLRQVVR
jgi:hypothetical protein